MNIIDQEVADAAFSGVRRIFVVPINGTGWTSNKAKKRALHSATQKYKIPSCTKRTPSGMR